MVRVNEYLGSQKVLPSQVLAFWHPLVLVACPRQHLVNALDERQDGAADEVHGLLALPRLVVPLLETHTQTK